MLPGKVPRPVLYTPKKTKDWEDHVAESARSQMLSVDVEGDRDFTMPIRDVRVFARIRFNITKPPSYSKKVVHATRKPDVDNLVKAVLDGLVNGKIIYDDDCITDLSVSKRYADGLEHPTGVEIELTCIEL